MKDDAHTVWYGQYGYNKDFQPPLPLINNRERAEYAQWQAAMAKGRGDVLMQRAKEIQARYWRARAKPCELVRWGGART